MKKIGIILLVFAALNLLVAIIASANGETYAAGSKFSGALLLGAIGGLLYYFGGKKEASNQESISRSSTLRYASVQDENFWQRYKRLNPTEANAIESVTERTMSLQSEKDAQEIVASMERWAKNIGCQINDIKTEFLQSYQSAFDNADTKEILEHLKNVKLREEANRFNISMQNTCTHFMIKWLTEDLRKESPQPANNQMKTRNKMSARDLVISENASLKFVENPNTGKVFFTCGSKKGYVSPAALEHMEQGELDDFCYAEVIMDGKTYIPCLMLVNKPTEKVVRSFDVKEDSTDKSAIARSIKKSEIKKQLYSLMIHFIQTEYGDIVLTADNIDDLNILSIPLANARTCYEDNENFICTCNLYGLDYSEILEEVSKQIIDYYMSKNRQEDTDLPF